MNRKLLAGLLVILGLGAIALVATLGEPSDSNRGAEERLRRALTRPGPDQVAPDGERPEAVRCRSTGDQRWICSVRYPSGLRIRCHVGERPLDQGPVCE